MGLEISIRRLSANDVIENFDEISDLLQEIYLLSFANCDIGKDYFNKKVDELIKYVSEDKAIVFGAFLSKLIGFIWCYRRTFLNEERLHINHFIVNYPYQGQGVGRSLIQKAESYATEEKIKAIDLMVTSKSPSVNFYMNNGFTIERYQMAKEL